VTPGLSEIREKLTALRAIGAGSLFGASSHGMTLRPPLAPTDVGAVVLPEGYRDFLLELGNGGIGPYHGLLSLSESLGWVDNSWGRAGLGEDFPLTEDIDFGELLAKPKSWNEHAKRLEDEPTYARAWEELQEKYKAPEYHRGVLPIAEYGCGDFFFLVVSGEREGSVWVDSLGSATGIYCLETDFLGFYGCWLSDALERAKSRDFAPRNAQYAYLEFGKNSRYRRV
jgi:SMI1 / KNR4 family (SUKH-1)